MLKLTGKLMLTAALAFGAIGASAMQTEATPQAQLAEQVRKQIVTLPFYSVFDNLLLQVNGNEVVLSGSVYRPSLKKSAERVALRVEGVDRVVNNIEIQRTSSFDDRIRVALLRQIYGNQVLSRYAWGAVPPIHLVVNNGDVTLEGVVAREMDKNIAGIVANGVSGVFSVTNNLRVASKG